VGTSKPKPFFSFGITPDFRITVKVFNPEKSKVIQKQNYKTFEPQSREGRKGNSKALGVGVNQNQGHFTVPKSGPKG
jgi:hypothetical protein